jgi:hypothetical protein
MATMEKYQILGAIRLMQPKERLEIMEFTLLLMREEITKNDTPSQLSLVNAAEIMDSYYAEGSELTEFSDLCQEDFYEYKDYA